ncbi:hypothetical protein LP421_32415 (plasmid) [Rhizobium sp. RCAM05350]|nr:hypothetical protein LP421_32415 [Rhizobium sp. RCAM05350]
MAYRLRDASAPSTRAQLSALADEMRVDAPYQATLEGKQLLAFRRGVIAQRT